jgi:hypothetical protein
MDSIGQAFCPSLAALTANSTNPKCFPRQEPRRAGWSLPAHMADVSRKASARSGRAADSRVLNRATPSANLWFIGPSPSAAAVCRRRASLPPRAALRLLKARGASIWGRDGSPRFRHCCSLPQIRVCQSPADGCLSVDQPTSTLHRPNPTKSCRHHQRLACLVCGLV